MHQFKTEQWLPITSEQAWEFFSAPENLARITPPELRFNILSAVIGRPIHDGMRIDYLVSPLLSIPLRWTTLIEDVHKPYRFTDIQIRGPYRQWIHVHTFRIQDNGILMTDEVSYRLPLGLIGRMMHRLFIQKKIDRIFQYRRKILEHLFNHRP